MHRGLRLFVAAAIIVGSLLPLVPQTAKAATPGGIQVAPALKQLEVSSGLIEAHSSVLLTNNTAGTVSASLRTADLSSINNSFGFGGGSASHYGLANWITLPGGSEVTIAPGATATVPVVVQNRSDLSPGGHYGAIIATTTSSTSGSNQVGFKQELVSLLFVKKLGGEQYGLKLTDIVPGNGGQPSTVTLTFQATGDTDSIPRGFVQITDSRGTVIAKGIINVASTVVLPTAIRQFDVSLHTVAHGAPGRNTLTVYYRPDGVQQFQSQSIYLHGIDWPLLAKITVLFILSAGVLAKTYRRRKRSRLHTAN